MAEDTRPLIDEEANITLAERVPHACDGAAPALCMWTTWCLFLLVIPLAGCLPLYKGWYPWTVPASYRIYLLVGLIALPALSLLYLVYLLRPVLCGGVCCLPVAPPITGPFLATPLTGDDRKKDYSVEVRRLYVVINPNAGQSGGAETLGAVRTVWEREFGIEVLVVESEYAGHVRILAQTLPLEDIDAFCVIGGDGTLHEATNGMLTRTDGKRVPLGFIPGGSGNSLMKDLNCWDVNEAARRIGTGRVKWLDASLVTLDGGVQLYSVNVVAVGLVGNVGVMADKWRWLGARRSLDLCAVWNLMKLASVRTGVMADGREVFDADMVTAFFNQTQTFGFNMRACPYAKLDDGLLDCAILPAHGTSRSNALQAFLQLIPGAHSGSPWPKLFTARDISIRCQQRAGVVNIDGELVPFLREMKVTCVQQAYAAFVPQDVFTPTPRGDRTVYGSWGPLTVDSPMSVNAGDEPRTPSMNGAIPLARSPPAAASPYGTFAQSNNNTGAGSPRGGTPMSPGRSPGRAGSPGRFQVTDSPGRVTPNMASPRGGMSPRSLGSPSLGRK